MAQALFSEHPIELYLRESGEVPELMPGGLDEFTREATHGTASYRLDAPQTWFPHLFNTIQPMFESVLTKFGRSSASSEFAERFKYIVISSPLLSSPLSSSSISRAATPTTPGHFDQSNPILPPSSSAVSPTVSGVGPHIPTYILACLVPLALTRGYYLSCIPLLAAVKFLSDGGPTSLGFSNGEEPWTLTLDCLEALIAANNTWDNVVGETFGILEAEEQSLSSPPSHSSTLPSLHIALSSSLHTTETQCDNIRQLLTSLTSSLVLSQLSHMYAPPPQSCMSPSPKRSRPMSLAPPSPERFRTTSQVRPLSLSNPLDDAYTRSRVGLTSQTTLADKRSTWSGSYIPVRGSSRRPSRSAIIRIEDLDSPKAPASFVSSSSSHVLTPPVAMEDSANAAEVEEESFGLAALDLHRRRRSMRAPLLNSPSLSSNIACLSSPDTPSQLHSPHGPLLASSLGPNFTASNFPPSTSQHAHHLSLSNLHVALQGALGSKRFACAHLLALRFSDFNDSQSRNHPGSADVASGESYWEDVRSIISLLTSRLESTSSRLADALADRARKQEQEPQIITDEAFYNLTSHEPIESNNSSVPPSFAPMPSHLARFAAHINAVSSALEGARDHLQQCVASLKEGAEVTSCAPEDPESPPIPLQSYERLRRELGFALRECERGRGTLLEIVKRTTPDHLPEDDDDEESPIRQEEQFSSGESDKTLYNAHEAHESEHTYVDQEQDHDPSVHDDDVTLHLIQTATSQHLRSGVEQVFESVSATQPFVRERSKLTREERIRIAKVGRESRFNLPHSVPASHEREPHPRREKWGPGGEVVQELKDVIWQVSERRRKMIERASLAPNSDALHSPT